MIDHLIGISSITALRLAIASALRDRSDGLIILTHPADWQRPAEWPLPHRRHKPSSGGVIVQPYRVDAIREYCAWCERPPRPAPKQQDRAA